MTQGFGRKPMVYSPWRKPYYERLLIDVGFSPVKRGQVSIESWGDRPLAVRKKEMLEIYNYHGEDEAPAGAAAPLRASQASAASRTCAWATWAPRKSSA